MIKTLAKACLDFVFPQSCLHCQEPISFNKVFCARCIEYMELKDPHEALTSPHSSYQGQAYCFESLGPIVSLLDEFYKKKNAIWAKSLAAYALIQWGRLNWEMPDAIFVANQAKPLWSAEDDPHILLSKAFAKMMNRPLIYRHSFKIRMKEVLSYVFKKQDLPTQEKIVLQIELGGKYHETTSPPTMLQNYKHRYKLSILSLNSSIKNEI